MTRPGLSIFEQSRRHQAVMAQWHSRGGNRANIADAAAGTSPAADAKTPLMAKTAPPGRDPAAALSGSGA